VEKGKPITLLKFRYRTQINKSSTTLQSDRTSAGYI